MRRGLVTLALIGLLTSVGGIARAQTAAARVASELMHARALGGVLSAVRAPLAAAHLAGAGPAERAAVLRALQDAGLSETDAAALLAQVTEELPLPPTFEACLSGAGTDVGALARLTSGVRGAVGWPETVPPLPHSDHRIFIENHGVLVPVSAEAWFAQQGVRYAPHLLFEPGVEARLPEPQGFTTPAGDYEDAIRSGEMAPLYVAELGDPIGVGVFAAADIQKGQYIGEYTGIVRPSSDVKDATYSLAYTAEWYKEDHTLHARRYAVDAQLAGNLTRYVNHAWEPNVEVKRVVLDGLEHPIMIATEPIPRGTQLLFNYDYGYWAAKKIDPINLRDPVPLPYRVAAGTTPPGPSDVWELLEGEWVAAPEPTADERALAQRIVNQFREAADGDAELTPEPGTPVLLGANTQVRPDAVFYAKFARPEAGKPVAPRIVVEILSPGSARRDLVWKRELYERNRNIHEYWIVDPLQQTLTRYVRNDGAKTFTRRGVHTAEERVWTSWTGGIEVGDLFGGKP